MRLRWQKSYTLYMGFSGSTPGPTGELCQELKWTRIDVKPVICASALALKKCLGKAETISKKGYFPAVMERPQDCIGCKMCYMMCPDIAITVIKE